MESTRTFVVRDRNTNEVLPGEFVPANTQLTEHAIQQAVKAFRVLRWTDGPTRAKLLRTIGEKLEAVRPEIVARAMAESGLPEVRLQGELTRTINQAKMFADLVETDRWKDERFVSALPDRTPPRPELAYEHRPLGPVVVFGASNFPLAFSVAGGDTVSALAAGCPVIVKAHPAHPGTSEFAGRAIADAVSEVGLPCGTFALLFDDGYAVGAQLVRASEIKAVGFTGSRKGGLALMSLIEERELPIPFYGEMSSINPSIVMPSVTANNAVGFADAVFASCTLGVGQFCTNPGVFFYVGDPAPFVARLKELMEAAKPGVMLTDAIGQAYLEGFKALTAVHGIDAVVTPSTAGAPGLALTNCIDFRTERHSHDEVFGPSTLVVECGSVRDALECMRTLEGQLTASVHGTADEITQDVRFAMEEVAGRIIFNQFPTGVEVCEAMVHGGPFPATSDGRSTSVGTAAIYRWIRPICRQNWPS